VVRIPIYEYQCVACGKIFENIESVSINDWENERIRAIECIGCKKFSAYKIVSRFKIGSKSLDTTGKSGYQDDTLTLGKIIDNDGIPYEFKADLKKREERIKETKKYIKEVKERGKTYGFDPFCGDEKIGTDT